MFLAFLLHVDIITSTILSKFALTLKQCILNLLSSKAWLP